jgi:hypothetical protein
MSTGTRLLGSVRSHSALVAAAAPCTLLSYVEQLPATEDEDTPHSRAPVIWVSCTHSVAYYAVSCTKAATVALVPKRRMEEILSCIAW